MVKSLLSFLVVMILGIRIVLPQQVVSTGGAWYSNSSSSVSMTIGETITETYLRPGGILTNGFQQPELSFLPITGPVSVCAGTTGIVYKTAPG